MPHNRSIHLVGSLSLSSNVECFHKVSELAGPGVARLPDGETGPRDMWIGWQAGKLACNLGLQSEG